MAGPHELPDSGRETTRTLITYSMGQYRKLREKRGVKEREKGKWRERGRDKTGWRIKRK